MLADFTFMHIHKSQGRTNMIKIHYLQTIDGAIQYYDCYTEDRKDAYTWLLNKGYEIVGES